MAHPPIASKAITARSATAAASQITMPESRQAIIATRKGASHHGPLGRRQSEACSDVTAPNCWSMN